MPSFGNAQRLGELFVDFTGRNAQLVQTAAQSEVAVKKASGSMEASTAQAAASTSKSSALMANGWLIAGTAVAGFVTLGVRYLQKLDAAEKQTGAVLKSTGGIAGESAKSIRDRANELENLSSVDDIAIQSGENLLLTFTNIRNGVGQGNQVFDLATKAVLDMSVAMGTDMSTAAIQVGKALQDPILGVTSLQRVGVRLNEQQKEQIRLMVESGNVMGAQKIILHELNVEFGGSAEALGTTLQGRMRLFLDSIEDLSASMMQDLLPALADFADWGARAVHSLLPVIHVVLELVGAGVKLLGFLGDINPILPVLAVGFVVLNRALLADLVAFRAMPVALATTETAFWGVETASTATGASLAATALKAKLFGLIVVGAAVAGGNAITKMNHALSTSNEELAGSLGVTVDKVEAIRKQMDSFSNAGALGWLNPFDSRAAITLEHTNAAVAAYKQVLQEAADAGLSEAEIQAKLTLGWGDAVKLLGGSGKAGVDEFTASLEDLFGLTRVEVGGQVELVKKLDDTGHALLNSGAAAAYYGEQNRVAMGAVSELTDEQKKAALATKLQWEAINRGSDGMERFEDLLHNGAGRAREFGSYLALTGQDADTFRSSLEAALSGSQADVDTWVSDQKSKLAEWRSGAEEAFNGVKQSLQGFAGQSKVSAKEIIKAFEDQLETMATYHTDFDKLVTRLGGRSQDLVVYLQSMGLQGSGIVHALSTANKEEFAKIIGDWEKGKAGAKGIAGTIQEQLVGAIDRLVTAIEGIPGWAMNLSTSRAQDSLDAVFRKANTQGFIFVKHKGGWVDDPSSQQTKRELGSDEVIVVAQKGEWMVDARTAQRHADLLAELPRYHDGGWIESQRQMAGLGRAFGDQATGWSHTGRHVDGAVTAKFKMDPDRWAEAPSGGGSYGGSGHYMHGWDGHGSPAALYYRALVQAAWPMLRFGGMYNRRYIKGSNTWSQHAYGNAIDEMTPSLSYGDQVYSWIRARASQFHLAHLLWRVPDHFNHIHGDFWPQGTGTPYAFGGVGEFDRPTFLPMMVGDGGARERVTVEPVGRLGPLGGSRSHADSSALAGLLEEVRELRRAVQRQRLQVSVPVRLDSRDIGDGLDRRRVSKR